MNYGHRHGEISVTFMSGPLDGKTITFDQPEVGDQKIIAIGRRDTCDIHLSFDNQVSRLHARLGCVASPVSESKSSSSRLLSFWLEDSNSRNGTFVEKNPDRIEDRLNLRPGTLFRIGRTWLRLDEPLTFG